MIKQPGYASTAFYQCHYKTNCYLYFVLVLLVSIFPQKNNFFSLGVYTALSIIHGGSGMPVFAEPVYDYFITGKYQKVEIDAQDIPDTFLKFIIEKVICEFLIFLHG